MASKHPSDEELWAQLPEHFRHRLGPLVPKYTVAWVGHSLVSWESLNPNWQPIPNVTFTLFRRSGAKLTDFEQYPEFQAALQSRADLAIIWLGGNDINPHTDITQLVSAYHHVKHLFMLRDIPVVFQTIEPRKYPPGHFAYISVQQYNKIRNSVNRHIQNHFYGNIFITGGLCFTPNLLDFDGVHPIPQGRKQIQNKIIKLVCHKFGLPEPEY